MFFKGGVCLFLFIREQSMFFRRPSIKMILYTLIFFIDNQGQDSALKVAYIFKLFAAQSCLIVAQYFDQVTYVCEEELCQLFQLFYAYYKGKTPLFFNLQFLLLFSERCLNPESCLAICHPRLVELLINQLLIIKLSVVNIITSKYREIVKII